VLRTRSPLIPGPKPRSPFDLHVLSAPPAFVLSQDQTLRRDTDRSAARRLPIGRVPFGVGRRREAPRAGLSVPSVAGRHVERQFPRHGEPSLGLTRHWHSHAVQFSRCGRRRDPCGEDSQERAPTGDGSSLATGVNLGPGTAMPPRPTSRIDGARPARRIRRAGQEAPRSPRRPRPSACSHPP
jgi:hypothetical protein